MKSPCLDAALDYLKRGWSAIPLCPPDHYNVPGHHEKQCQSPGKAPLWPWKEYQDRLPQPAALHLLWTKNPQSNVGIVMGKVSGLIGLDLDGYEGEKMMEQWSGGKCPPTLQFITGHGRRVLFKYPTTGAKIKSHKQDGKEAIRILADGSQTVAPPSKHPFGGDYQWVVAHGPGEIEPAECPDWLIAKLIEEQPIQPTPQQTTAAPSTTYQQIDRATKYLQTCDPAISGQGGHNQTYKVACKLIKGFALDIDTALSLLLQVYNPKCQPPWNEKELRHKLEDALKSPAQDGYLLNGKTKQNGFHHNDTPPAPPEAVTRNFASIVKKEVEWLWPAWIPLGKLTIVDGDPGLGKSTMLLDLAARISNNAVMPDQSWGTPGRVIVMSAEDAPEDTIKPRLEAAGANLQRIIDLSHVTLGGKEQPPEIPRDIPLIEAKIREHEARLLIIDPLMAFLFGADANKDQEIRRVLYRLSKVAEKLRCSIVCMRHLNKGSGLKAIYRGNSSIGVIGHARVGLLVGIDPDDENKRILACNKTDLGPKPKSLRFALEPIENVCRIGWCGSTNYIADQLVAPPETDAQKEEKQEAKSKIEQAKTILNVLLEDGQGKVEIKAAKAECSAAGLSTRSVERAVKELALIVHYTSEGGIRTYYWSTQAPNNNGEVAE